MYLSRDDAAFIVGTGGSCKAKIERVSGASLDLDRNLKLIIRGTALQRKRACKYVKLVSDQRTGPVHLDPVKHFDDDLTLIEVPVECVGYVTGKKGATMRKVEEEWDTLMFFISDSGKGKNGKWEKLAIFGEKRGRRGAELKVMSAVEQKLPGHYTSSMGDTQTEDEWGTDTALIPERDMSYALGKRGATRKKLARASGCIMEYVGTVAFMSGHINERKRAREYLHLLMEQRLGPVHLHHAQKRDDCTLVDVPTQCVGYVTGSKGRSLRAIELRTDTFCFMDGGKDGHAQNQSTESSKPPETARGDPRVRAAAARPRAAATARAAASASAPACAPAAIPTRTRGTPAPARGPALALALVHALIPALTPAPALGPAPTHPRRRPPMRAGALALAPAPAPTRTHTPVPIHIPVPHPLLIQAAATTTTSSSTTASSTTTKPSPTQGEATAPQAKRPREDYEAETADADQLLFEAIEQATSASTASSSSSSSLPCSTSAIATNATNTTSTAASDCTGSAGGSVTGSGGECEVHGSTKVVRVSVGGVVYTTTLMTLTSDPESMLAAMFSGRFRTPMTDDGCFFIDYEGSRFGAILNWLRTGVLHTPIKSSGITEPLHYLDFLLQDARYFQISKLVAAIEATMEELRANAQAVAQLDRKSKLTQKEVIKILNSTRPVQLASCDMSGLDLSGLDFSSANLQFANFSGATLRHTIFQNGKLQGCDFSGANLEGANLSNSDLLNSNFTRANLQRAVMVSINAPLAVFQFAELQYSNFENANLSGANMTNADLNSTELTGAKLQGACLHGVSHVQSARGLRR
ncbi:domain K-type RNA binding proteins family protein [Pelomyxa schiedti]|nr:domain K-type RNA binding proteins family protein [Pelomyxa schiedti]